MLLSSTVTVTEGRLPRARGAGWEGRPGPTAGSECLSRSLCSAAPHRLCFVCMVGVIVLVPFSSLSPLYRIFHVATAPVSTSCHSPRPGPSPVNVYIASHSMSTCLRHGRLRCGTARTRPRCPFAHSCADAVALYRAGHCGLQLGPGPLRPSASRRSLEALRTCEAPAPADAPCWCPRL